MSQPEFKFKKPIHEILKSKMHPYSFQVGVLQDKPHKQPGKGMKMVAGSPGRKVGRKLSGLSIAEVARDARKQLHVNYLLKPFSKGSKKNADVLKVVKTFLKLVFGQGKLASKKRLENALQAVVRNPLLRADYGKNKRLTRRIKGSSKKFLDTFQLFRAITARVRVTRVSK